MSSLRTSHTPWNRHPIEAFASLEARTVLNQQSKLAGIDDARRLQLLIDAIVDYAIYMIDLDGRRELEFRCGAAQGL